ncbi:hypothetical protein GQ42DRAFT_161770 [Ramicandelaber brevisporus]|nr:hypothetical protein GQ42DRAFT_161770 [Ramicandelaber brevisporus]
MSTVQLLGVVPSSFLETPFKRFRVIVQTQRVRYGSSSPETKRGPFAILLGSQLGDNWRGNTLQIAKDIVSILVELAIEKHRLRRLRSTASAGEEAEKKPQRELVVLGRRINANAVAEHLSETLWRLIPVIATIPLETVYTILAADEGRYYSDAWSVAADIADNKANGASGVRGFFSGILYDIASIAVFRTVSVGGYELLLSIERHFAAKDAKKTGAAEPSPPSKFFGWIASHVSLSVATLAVYPLETLSKRAKLIAAAPSVSIIEERYASEVHNGLFDGCSSALAYKAVLSSVILAVILQT